MVGRDKKISVRKQCKLLSVDRSKIYYNNVAKDNVDIINDMKKIYQECPFYGYRKMHSELKNLGYNVNRKKVQRLMQLEGLRAIYPKKNLSVRNQAHAIYPYLLKNMTISTPNQVWQIDITYIKIKHGFVYLAAIIDVFSRRIMGWQLSPFLDTSLCLQALDNALKISKPEILNSDQGCQFTSNAWVSALKERDIKISMDGKGRWADNVFIERFWRSAKYESVLLQSFDSVAQAKKAIDNYIKFYNNLRPHQTLKYKTPKFIYDNNLIIKLKELKCFDFPVKTLSIELINENIKNSHKQTNFWS